MKRDLSECIRTSRKEDFTEFNIKLGLKFGLQTEIIHMNLLLSSQDITKIVAKKQKVMNLY